MGGVLGTKAYLKKKWDFDSQLIYNLIGRLPGINNLIGKINTRRKRDTVIMALVISMCTILIMLYWLRT